MQKYFPSPFTLAVLLTFLTMLLAWGLTAPGDSTKPHIFQIFGFWEKGFWELLTFGMQMVLILVLGHVLVLTKPVNTLIQKLVRFCDTTARAAGLLALFTIVVALLNWGLGLIFGAIFARKIGEHASQNDIKLNYPLIGAAGYVGLLVWHGGLSGSAPLVIAGESHFMVAQIGTVSLAETLFSPTNLITTLLLLLLLPAFMYWLGRRNKGNKVPHVLPLKERGTKEPAPTGAERLDRSKLLAYGLGLCIAGTGIYKIADAQVPSVLNIVNFLLFGAGLLLHGSIKSYKRAVDKAVGGASGIIIQFPLYAGIMGIMKYSGLVATFSTFFAGIASADTFPIVTFFSGAVVNFFVPSGGGQWAVQGPLIAEAARQLGTSFPKCVMAFAYGDQLSNMMQPFWALPLLGITGLKAQQILPYTLLLMSAGGIIFLATLIVF